MAIAAEALAPEAAAAPAVAAASSRAPRQPRGSVSLPVRAVSGPSETAKTITRLVWAVAIGLIVLEVASQATGQFWTFNLQGPALQKQAYRPLYGQAQTAAALPGILAGTPGLKLAPGIGGQ